MNIMAFERWYLAYLLAVDKAKYLLRCGEKHPEAYASFECCNTHRRLNAEHSSMKVIAEQLWPGHDTHVLSINWWKQMGRVETSNHLSKRWNLKGDMKRHKSDAHTKHCCFACGCQFDADFICTVVQGDRIQEHKCGSTRCKPS